MNDAQAQLDSSQASATPKSDDQRSGGAPDKRGAWRPARSSVMSAVVFVAVIVAGVLVVLAAWQLPPFATTRETTEDAYVSGRSTVISPEVSGYVEQVMVEDFASVRRGEVLVTIDPRTYQHQFEQARADLQLRLTNLANNRQTLARARADVAAQEGAVANAQAQMAKARADLDRSSDLVRDGSVSARENDQNLAALRQTQAAVTQAQAARESAMQQVRSVLVNGDALAAQVEQARATVDAARLQVDRTVIHAPVDGQLSEIGVRPGQFVTAGTQLFFLVPPEIWIIANFKEGQTRHMAIGQPAGLTIDALASSERIRGRVDRMSPATGSQFAVLKANNATGNFIKVPQRISVRILVDEGQALAARLKPGMSVEVSVDTAAAGTTR